MRTGYRERPDSPALAFASAATLSQVPSGRLFPAGKCPSANVQANGLDQTDVLYLFFFQQFVWWQFAWWQFIRQQFI